VCAANAGDIEGRSLKGAQEPLLDWIEEIDAFDGFAGRDAESGETIKRPGAGRETVEGGQVGELTTIAANQDLAKVRQAVDGLFDWGQGAGGRPLRCSALRWCLKEETSLLVVSRRRTSVNLPYILIADLPKRCLMQVPSMRVANRLPIS
jgi:hypothetical protein